MVFESKWYENRLNLNECFFHLLLSYVQPAKISSSSNVSSLPALIGNRKNVQSVGTALLPDN